MSESAISAKRTKQIFANFVKFAEQTFSATLCPEGGVTEAEYPTNYQRISNLSLTIRPFRVAILAVLLLFVAGWNSEVLGADDCNYITNQAGTVSSYVSGGKGTLFNPYKYKLNQYTSLGSITNTYGIDKISCSVKLESVTFGKSAKAKVQYSTNNSTWNDVDDEQEISNGDTKNYTKTNCAIAAGGTVYF